MAGSIHANKRTTGRDQAEARARKPNPFLVQNEEILPYVPDDENFSYLWMRVELDGKDDGRNMIAHLNGKLQYEIVRPEMVPQLGVLNVNHAKLAQCIKVQDVVLARVPKEMKQLYLEACEIRAEQMAAALKDTVRNRLRDPSDRPGVGFDPHLYHDRETRDGRPVSIDED